MIVIGIDDTDTIDGPGTNQLARRIAAALAPGYALESIVRHQLLFDPRISYTSKNGSASLVVRAAPGRGVEELIPRVRAIMREHFQPGSDPGLCVAEAVPDAVIDFGLRCKREPVPQAEARALARAAGIHLEGLGGSEDGVIGALAAVGLRATGEDGRVVHMDGWGWPDPFAGPQPVNAILARGVSAIVERDTGRGVTAGVVDVGKHLRPAFRGGRAVLFVEAVPPESASGAEWRALKLE